MTSDISNKFTKIFFKMTLYSGGVFSRTLKYRTAEIVHSIIITVASLILSAGTIIAVINVSNFQIHMEIYSYLVSYITCLILYWGMRYYRRRLILTTTKMQNSVCWTGKSVGKATYRIENYVRKYLLVIKICYVASFVSYLTSPLFIALIKRDYFSKEAYTVPFWFQCKSVKNSFIIEWSTTQICWNNHTFLSYLTTNIVCIMLFFISTLTCVTTFIYYLLVIVYTKGHTDAIIKDLKFLATQIKAEMNTVPRYIAFKMIPKRKSYPIESGRQYTNRNQIPEKEVKIKSWHLQLNEIVSYYQKLYSVIKTCRPMLCFFAGCHFFLQYSLMTSSVVLIVKELETTMSAIYILKLTLTIGSFLIIMIIFCYGGEIISSINSSIAEHVYNLPWYDIPSCDFQLKVYDFLLLLNKPINIVTIGTSTVNLRAFMAGANRIYSLISLLLAKSELY